MNLCVRLQLRFHHFNGEEVFTNSNCCLISFNYFFILAMFWFPGNARNSTKVATKRFVALLASRNTCFTITSQSRAIILWISVITYLRFEAGEFWLINPARYLGGVYFHLQPSVPIFPSNSKVMQNCPHIYPLSPRYNNQPMFTMNPFNHLPLWSLIKPPPNTLAATGPSVFKPIQPSGGAWLPDAS